MYFVEWGKISHFLSIHTQQKKFYWVYRICRTTHQSHSPPVYVFTKNLLLIIFTMWDYELKHRLTDSLIYWLNWFLLKGVRPGGPGVRAAWTGKYGPPVRTKFRLGNRPKKMYFFVVRPLVCLFRYVRKKASREKGVS